MKTNLNFNFDSKIMDLSNNKMNKNIEALSDILELNQNTSTSFKEILKTSQSTAVQEALYSLIDQIDRQSKLTIKSPNLQNISKYKNLVSDFINIASQNFECEELELYSHNGYRKNVTGSFVIDNKIELITKDFLESNKLSMESISAFAEIKGLLLDVII